MPSGTVKWFDDSKGFGFIEQDDGGDDLFLHHSSIQGGAGFRTLKKGQRVSYELTLGPKGKQASGVVELSGSASEIEFAVERGVDLHPATHERRSSIESVDSNYIREKYLYHPIRHIRLAVGAADLGTDSPVEVSLGKTQESTNRSASFGHFVR